MTTLSVLNATKHYQYDTYPAFENISFEASSNEVCSLVFGPQGGKTTFAKVLMGEEKLSQGEVIYDGISLCDIPTMNRDIAYISLPILFTKGKVHQNICFGLYNRGIKKPVATDMAICQMTKFGILNLADRKVCKLDIVQQCKLAFARAYIRKVRLAIFDNILGIDKQIDAIVDEMIEYNKQNDIITLNLCDKMQCTKGKIYDLRKIDLDKITIDLEGKE